MLCADPLVLCTYEYAGLYGVANGVINYWAVTTRAKCWGGKGTWAARTWIRAKVAGKLGTVTTSAVLRWSGARFPCSMTPDYAALGVAGG